MVCAQTGNFALTENSRRKYLMAIITLVIFGEICRLAQYLSRQSLATAEVQLVMNVQRHTPSELPFVKLDYFPLSPVAAPPVFLWFTKMMGERYQYGELALRLIPTLLSMATLPLFAWMVWRLLTPITATWAVALFALSDSLIFQGATAKPYSGDVLIAMIILWLAFSDSPRGRFARIIAASLLTTYAVWFSYTTVFAFAAAAIIWGFDMRKKPRQLVPWFVLCAIPAASFVIVYILSMRVQRTGALDDQWQSMIPNYSRPLSIPGWFIARTWELFQYQLFPIGQAMLIAAIAGGIALVRTDRRRLLCLLIAPIALDVIAGLSKAYIYGGSRITLFLAPSLLILIAIGIAALPELLNKWGTALQVLLAIIPVTMGGLAVYQLFQPRTDGEMQTAVAFLNKARHAGEPVYVEPHDASQLACWYGPDDAPDVHLVTDAPAPVNEEQFWMVLAYNPRKYHKTSLALNQPGHRIDESRSFHGNGADVLWFVREKPK
jgi:hypothetical protein